MYKIFTYCLTLILLLPSLSEGKNIPIDSVKIEFLGKTSVIPSPGKLKYYDGIIAENPIISYAKQIDSDRMRSIAFRLNQIKVEQTINDWLFYQLIRRTAEQCISKKEDYIGYTLYKWYLLKSCGYEPLISISKNKILLYVKSNDEIYNLPLKNLNNRQFVCLNYHDYDFNIALNEERFTNLTDMLDGGSDFSFNIQQLPPIDKHTYQNKQISFTYKQRLEHINVLLNPELRNYFKNYPVTDYQNQFNIPLSRETYQSLINSLKEKLKKLDVIDGVEYLMYFTRNGFEYEKDTDFFGREKRLSPEETLLYEKSDCEDRSALLYFLIKEIYNLPMIVVTYPTHVTLAVKLNKPVKNQIIYKGEPYAICEPTPQKRDLKIGMLAKEYEKESFEVAYAYNPLK